MRFTGDKIKVCYLAQSESLHTQVYFKAMRERNVGCSCVTFDQGADDGSVPVTRLNPVSFFLSKRSAVKKAVALSGADILHSHQLIGYGMWGWLSGKKPFVASAWGSDLLIQAKSSFLNGAIARRVMKKCDRLHVPTRFMAESAATFGCPREKIFTQVIGTDIEMFSPSVADRSLREKIGVHPAIVCTRNFEEVYSVPTAIRAMPLVLKHSPGAKLVLVGGGSQKVQAERLVNDLGLADAVIFAGQAARPEVARHLASSDLWVDPSISSAGVSIGLLEAMSCGLPTISTKLPGVDEAIKDGENGLLFPAGDHEALARLIIQSLKDEPASRAMGAAARRTALEIGDQKKCMDSMLAMYESLLKR